MELKTIDLNAESFVAKDVTYYIKPSLSIERFRMFEKYQVEMGYGRSFKDLSDNMDKAIDFANKGKGLEAWNIIFNLKEGIRKNLDKSTHPAMLICALFFVTADEDLTKWDEQMAKAKIANWSEDGYEIEGFFRIAANLVNGYIDILEGIFQSTSGLEEVMRKVEELNESKQESST